MCTFTLSSSQIAGCISIYLSFLGLLSQVPPTGWLEQQKFIVSQFWGLQTWNQDALRTGCNGGFCGMDVSRASLAGLWVAVFMSIQCFCHTKFNPTFDISSFSIIIRICMFYKNISMISLNFCLSHLLSYSETSMWHNFCRIFLYHSNVLFDINLNISLNVFLNF